MYCKLVVTYFGRGYQNLPRRCGCDGLIRIHPFLRSPADTFNGAGSSIKLVRFNRCHRVDPATNFLNLTSPTLIMSKSMSRAGRKICWLFSRSCRCGVWHVPLYQGEMPRMKYREGDRIFEVKAGSNVARVV
jgi:hypothetical protein